MLENISFGLFHPDILFGMAPGSLFLLAYFCYSFDILDLKLSGQVYCCDRICHFFDFLNKNITHGECYFRQQTAADRSTAGKRHENNRQILGISQLIFRKCAQLAGVVFTDTLAVHFYITILNTCGFSDFLVIGVVRLIHLLTLEDKCGIISHDIVLFSFFHTV